MADVPVTLSNLCAGAAEERFQEALSIVMERLVQDGLADNKATIEIPVTIDATGDHVTLGVGEPKIKLPPRKSPTRIARIRDGQVVIDTDELDADRNRKLFGERRPSN